LKNWHNWWKYFTNKFYVWGCVFFTSLHREKNIYWPNKKEK